MKFKYYLRGIGIGILVTVIVLSISSRMRPVSMSDEDVIKRAKELGMVESNDSQTILDLIEENNSEAGTETPEPSSEKVVFDDNPNPATDINNVEPAAPVETVTVVVEAGMFSDKIAQSLYAAGLIEDAAEFNKYLIANGYDSKICAGDYVFTKGMSFEELAVILTTKN